MPRKSISILFSIIFSISFLSFFISNFSVVASPISPHSISESGSFFLSNSSDAVTLLGNDIYSFNIGTVWNLSIYVHSNSSTNISISKLRIGGNPWDYIYGTSSFQVSAGENHSELYRSIVVCDNIQTTNFCYSLTDSNKNASGVYDIQKITDGTYVNFGTGCADGNEIPSSSSSSISFSSPVSFLISYLFLIFSCGFYFLFFRRKKAF